MADGFFFANDPDLSKIKSQKALAQALMQQGMGDAGSAPYGGIANALKEVAGAYLNSRSDKANSANYAAQLASVLGKDTLPADTPVTVTPQVQPDAEGNPVRTPNPDTMSWHGGALGLDRNKARMLAGVLQGVEPDTGRSALQSMVLDQLKPKSLEYHSPADNAYDSAGNVVHQGTPEAKPPTTTGGMQWDPKTGWTPIPHYVEQQLAIANARGDAAVAHRAPPRGGKPKPDKNNPLGLVMPWEH